MDFRKDDTVVSFGQVVGFDGGRLVINILGGELRDGFLHIDPSQVHLFQRGIALGDRVSSNGDACIVHAMLPGDNTVIQIDGMPNSDPASYRVVRKETLINLDKAGTKRLIDDASVPALAHQPEPVAHHAPVVEAPIVEAPVANHAPTAQVMPDHTGQAEHAHSESQQPSEAPSIAHEPVAPPAMHDPAAYAPQQPMASSDEHSKWRNKMEEMRNGVAIKPGTAGEMLSTLGNHYPG